MIVIETQNSAIYNQYIQLFTRFIVKSILNKKNINTKQLNKLYNSMFAFTFYFLYIDKNITYNFNNKIYTDTFNVVKKYSSVLIIKAILTNTLNYQFIYTLLIPTIIGFLVYMLLIKPYLDKYNNNQKININSILMHITDTLLIELIDSEPITIKPKINDLIGRYIYENFVKQKILFN